PLKVDFRAIVLICHSIGEKCYSRNPATPPPPCNQNKSPNFRGRYIINLAGMAESMNLCERLTFKDRL
ncbi:MAG: hypothetical protein V2I33_21580, partial [Kangiellaceae bacterium]|nr:hypothetical protein [Kangiellaceae bacterium]